MVINVKEVYLIMTENRVISGRFKKGQSGNPGGRPAKLTELTAHCKDMTPDVLQTIQGIILNGEAKDADRIAACRLVLEYGFGKATQVMEVDVRSQIDSMTNAEREQKINELLAKRAASNIIDVEICE